MNKRDIVIGVVILLFLAAVIFLRQRPKPAIEEVKLPETLSSEKKLEEKFKIEIPEGVEKSELRDVADTGASAVAIRKFEEGKFSLTIISDLPDLERGSFYEGWLMKGEEGQPDFSIVSIGRMRLAKGGYILDFESNVDYSDYKKVIVTLEKVADKNPEKRLFEGNF